MSLKNGPDELKTLKQWVCVSKDSKIPMQATAAAAASSTDNRTWSTFEEAERSVIRGSYDNAGFVFADNGIIGIDIDDGFDGEGFLSPIAVDIISKCQSYTERSRRGRGFHILLRGDIPFKGKNNLNGVEIYKTSRYFIMTGDTLIYNQLVENQQAIDYILSRYFSDHRESSEQKTFYQKKIYEPVWEKPSENGRVMLRPVYHVIPDGTRNISLTSLAGQWHTLGYSGEEIYRELLYVNAVACAPPLDNNELLSIVNSITRYTR